MLSKFYVDAHTNIVGTPEHWINVAVYFTFGFILLYLGKFKWSDSQRHRYIVYICGFIFTLNILKTIIRLFLGNFNHQFDLPFHVCNLVPLAIGLAYYFRNRQMFALFFFWIMCGTLQANVTPTLTDFFPHYESIRYWATHSWMPFIAVYGLIVLGYKIYFKDVIISWLSMTAGAYIVYHLNNALGSNYWFVNRKPDGTTMYDLLGDWPTYMFQLFPVALVLFTTMYIIVKSIEWLASIKHKDRLESQI